MVAEILGKATGLVSDARYHRVRFDANCHDPTHCGHCSNFVEYHSDTWRIWPPDNRHECADSAQYHLHCIFDHHEHSRPYDHIFTGKATVDWLMDCCTMVDRREGLELGSLFLELGLIAHVDPRNEKQGFIPARARNIHFPVRSYHQLWQVGCVWLWGLSWTSKCATSATIFRH